MTATTALTAREFLASVKGEDGEPLAKAGARGRFSRAGVAALDAERAKGVVFADDVKAAPKPKQVVAQAVKPSAPASKPAATPQVEAKDVRAWAAQNGHDVGARGRLAPAVITAFLAAGGKATVPTAKRPTPADMPKVRANRVAFGIIPRKAGDGKHITEPLLTISNCGSCSAAISRCSCQDGPRLPKWAGGAVAVLDRRLLTR